MKKICSILSIVPLLLLACSLHAAKSYDVLDLPAVKSPLAAHALIYSLTRAGDRVFATGIRGHILYSDDFGQNWTQAESVPVRSSLLDASFPSAEQGWVVGHEAVILHTEDGGRTWVKQLDGRELPKIGLEYYKKKLEEYPDDERFALLVDEMAIAMEQIADRPFFKILHARYHDRLCRRRLWPAVSHHGCRQKLVSDHGIARPGANGALVRFRAIA